MDVVYRVSVYVKRGDGEPMMIFRRLYAKRSTARGVATYKKNAYSGRWSGGNHFHHATIEVFKVAVGDTETIWT